MWRLNLFPSILSWVSECLSVFSLPSVYSYFSVWCLSVFPSVFLCLCLWIREKCGNSVCSVHLSFSLVGVLMLTMMIMLERVFYLFFFCFVFSSFCLQLFFFYPIFFFFSFSSSLLRLFPGSLYLYSFFLVVCLCFFICVVYLSSFCSSLLRLFTDCLYSFSLLFVLFFLFVLRILLLFAHCCFFYFLLLFTFLEVMLASFVFASCFPVLISSFWLLCFWLILFSFPHYNRGIISDNFKTVVG